MTAVELLDNLATYGISLTSDGVVLRVEGPTALMTEELLVVLRVRKPDLIAALAGASPPGIPAALPAVTTDSDVQDDRAFRFDERAAVREFDGGLPRWE